MTRSGPGNCVNCSMWLPLWNGLRRSTSFTVRRMLPDVARVGVHRTPSTPLHHAPTEPSRPLVAI